MSNYYDAFKRHVSLPVEPTKPTPTSTKEATKSTAATTSAEPAASTSAPAA